jgi:hypothetical protein
MHFSISLSCSGSLWPSVSHCYLSFFMWYWGLTSLTCLCCHLRHACTPFLFLVIFQIGSHMFYPGRLGTKILLSILPPNWGGRTQACLACCFRWGLANFSLGFLQTTDLSLLHDSNYDAMLHEVTQPGQFFPFFFIALWFLLRASRLLSRCSYCLSYALLALFSVGYFQDRVSQAICPGLQVWATSTHCQVSSC